MTTSTAFYDRADWYDFLHAPETDAELPAVLSIFGALGNGGKRILEPACGTGRYLEALRDRGYVCLGYDVNPAALSFARRRLKGKLLPARVVRGDMVRFTTKERFDLTFCLIGSFRHLLTEEGAVAHLKTTASLLNRGGLYILGLDLCDYGQATDDEEVWVHEDGRKKAWHVMTTLAPTRQLRRERIINFVSWRDGKKEGKFDSVYDLRSYDWPQWETLIEKAGLRLVGWYDQNGKKRSTKRPGYYLFALHSVNL